jgi:hypothetical protein
MQNPPRTNFETNPSCKTIGKPKTTTRSFPLIIPTNHDAADSDSLVTMKLHKTHQSFKKEGNYPTISPSLSCSIDPTCFNKSK